MPLTVVNVAYPFAPVGADSVGGAEQVLAQLDRALVRAGHRSIVVAVEGSETAGQLVALPAHRGTIDEAARTRLHALLRERLAALLEAGGIDVVHLHGVDFHAYLPPPGLPVLVSLHLPLAWYGPAALRPERPRTWLHPVSRAQAATAPPGAVLSAPLENGVALQAAASRKCGFALVLSRICPEKGIDDAIEAARRAGVPLLIAGRVFPHAEHERFFREAVEPRLGRGCRWLGPVGGRRKKWLLGHARCVLVASKVAETSSLTAMEALAAGTPVVAYAAGALPEVVEHGRTGFLAEDPAGLARGIAAAAAIDPEICRSAARRRFSLPAMTGRYLRRYAEIAARPD